MTERNQHQRTSHRVELRTPLPVRVDDQRAILLELGTGGAKIEHERKLDVGTKFTLPIRGENVRSIVRYCMMVPSEGGVVFLSGLEFTGASRRETAAIYELLLEEAQAQVAEWEANSKGAQWERPRFGVRSSVALRFLWLRLTRNGWVRTVTADPNQPVDGIAVPSDTSDDEIALLCSTYERGDEDLRQYLRGCAMVAILERLRPDA